MLSARQFMTPSRHSLTELLMSNTGRIFALLSNELDCPLSPCALGSKTDQFRLRIMDRPMRNKLISSLCRGCFLALPQAVSLRAVAADMPVKARGPPPGKTWVFSCGPGSTSERVIGGAWSSQDANSRSLCPTRAVKHRLLPPFIQAALWVAFMPATIGCSRLNFFWG